MYEYHAVVNRAVSRGGLKVNLSIDLGFGVGHIQSLPLHGVMVADPKAARAAAQWLDVELPQGTKVVCTVHKDVDGYSVTLYVEGQSMTVNDMLVSEGLALNPQPMSVRK